MNFLHVSLATRSAHSSFDLSTIFGFIVTLHSLNLSYMHLQSTLGVQ